MRFYIKLCVYKLLTYTQSLSDNQEYIYKYNKRPSEGFKTL